MKMSGGPASLNIKASLLFLGVLIAASTTFYTQHLIISLQNREKRIAELYANALKFVANSDGSGSDFTFIFDNIIKRIDFPLILTDSDGRLNPDNLSGSVRNLYIDPKLSREAKTLVLQEYIKDFSSVHRPILVKYNDSLILNRIYYGDSDLIKQLRIYPLFQILFAIVFVFFAYSGFNRLRKTEQGNLWVGMAKETAHQLGTPISSLLGWAELLKLSPSDPENVLQIVSEIEGDLSKLTKISKRFSKIGSIPELRPENVTEVIKSAIDYYKRRLPVLGRKVEIIFEGPDKAVTMLNAELFEWVMENLIKNSLDAIEKRDGRISFRLEESAKQIYIEVEDNGKGIDIKRRKDIFRPGYSTKRRGWGLGLSLSKRIIENYHKGKIFVKHSSLDQGTVFKIMLQKRHQNG